MWSYLQYKKITEVVLILSKSHFLLSILFLVVILRDTIYLWLRVHHPSVFWTMWYRSVETVVEGFVLHDGTLPLSH